MLHFEHLVLLFGLQPGRRHLFWTEVFIGMRAVIWDLLWSDGSGTIATFLLLCFGSSIPLDSESVLSLDMSLASIKLCPRVILNSCSCIIFLRDQECVTKGVAFVTHSWRYTNQVTAKSNMCNITRTVHFFVRARDEQSNNMRSAKSTPPIDFFYSLTTSGRFTVSV